VHQSAIAASPLAADPVRPGNSDLCFVWPGTAESAAIHLRARGIEIVEGPVGRTGAHGAGVSVYCRDPDGSLIELISYR
jgi:catechol 2,3-dioxygenase-like lactoylglutathione lyase family enzyme